MRVLFVSYYYPPSGGSGVQRALKFSRYLPEFGWDPVVLTVDPSHAAWPATDSSLVREIPDEISIHRTSAIDPYAAYAALLRKPRAETVGVGFIGESEPTWKERLARWIRGNLFLPDARVGWVPYAVARGRQLMREQSIDAIWTTGPPHSAHLIGRSLAHRFGLPWVADFRDPWTGIDYAELLPSSRLAQRVDAAMERSVLRKADAVVVVAPFMERLLSERHRRRYHVIPNGFDAADFSSHVPVDAQHFYVSHVGMMNEARNPTALWDAMASLDVPGRMPELRVRLVGRVDPIVHQQLAQRGLTGIVEHVPYLEHRDATRLMQQSALLLLVINRVHGAEGILTGKIFEYIGSGRPVLCVGPPQGDAARVLSDVGGGVVFDYQDVDGLARQLQLQYEAWKRGRPLEGAAAEVAGRYSRREQARELGSLLTEVRAIAREERTIP